MTPQDFIAALGPAAQAAQAVTKVYASFTIAEAALESGWGASELAREAFNLFGVKADKSWKGYTFSLPTKEFIQNQWVTVSALWRKYTNWQQCLVDHGNFLLDNPRYQPALNTTNVADFTQAIAAAGYATDPQYSQKIMEIINFHNLTQFDRT